MKTFRANSSQRGFTLIELMIAMLIGVFLMAGVIQIFLSAKQAYRLQENLSRLQENGRFAMDILTKDIRMAGFSGCASKTPPINIATPANPNPNPAVMAAIGTGVEGRDNVTTNNWNAIACGANNECVIGTDVISFQSVVSCGAQVSGNTIPDNANLKIPSTNTCGIQKYDVLLVSDCSNANIFVANNSVNGGGTLVTVTQANAQNSQAKLPNSFGNDAEIFKPRLMSYYIRLGAGGIPSLYRVDNTKPSTASPTDELIEGIENMQILYGVDSDLTPDYLPNYYVDASQFTDKSKAPGTIPTKNSAGATVNADGWTRVVSVRISLLAVTIENNLTDTPQPYFYNGTTTPPPQIPVLKTGTSQYCQAYTGTLPSNCQLVDDRRIHRVFSSTIAVRNRLP